MNVLKFAICILALCNLLPSLSFAAVPALPQAYLDTTFSLPTGGKTWTVRQGDDLQSTINSAHMGDVIVLQAGATFTDEYTLPNKTGTGWIYIISSDLAALPEGKRVGPADTSHMAKIVAPEANLGAIRAAWGAHNYRLAGIEITTNFNRTDNVQYGLVKLGYDADSQGADTLANLADNIILDRTYVHGSETGNNRDGIVGMVRRFGCVDSTISDFHGVGYESHGIQIFYGAGPIAITNNTIVGAGINLFLADNGPMDYNLLPQDVTIRGNYLYKPLVWKDVWTVKNLFEVKGGRRILLEGNVLENSWTSAQVGFGVLVTPRGGPVDDVTIQKNILRGCEQGFQLNPADVTINRLLLQNNLIYNITGSIFQAYANQLNTYEDLIINHNTVIHSNRGGGGGFLGLGMAEIEPAVQNVEFKDNLVTHGNYGIHGDNIGIGFVAVDTYITNYNFDKNVLIGEGVDASDWDMYKNPEFYGNRTAYTNFYLRDTLGEIGFTNTNLNQPADFALLPSSPYHNAATDGKDIGADIAALLAATAHAVDGGGRPPDNPTPPPMPPNPPPTPPSPISPDVGPEMNIISPKTGEAAVIKFTCEPGEAVEINIFNRGGRVRGPVSGACAAGTNGFTWDGRNEDGEEVASGIYLVMIQVGDKILAEKVAVLR
ncbi:MAG: hypothetical protein LHV69_03590 [Elusimicrobia bacterium]|nr:hypothetical protein [Candidatus Obscuribacterium magneticum]